MASITLSLPDDLALQIRAQERQLPQILELGLREFDARGQSGFDGAAEVLELLAALPTPEEVLNLRRSPSLAAWVAQIVEKSRAGEMTPADKEDWERYEYLEHLVRMAKGDRSNETRVFRGPCLISTPRCGSFVRSRAGGLCEYCRIPERFTLAEHEMDHVIAMEHGGKTVAANLALCCAVCNRFKGSDIASIDAESGQITPLFHPRTD